MAQSVRCPTSAQVTIPRVRGFKPHVKINIKKKSASLVSTEALPISNLQPIYLLKIVTYPGFPVLSSSQSSYHSLILGITYKKISTSSFSLS